jgi:uncharacterized protein YkuJ
MKAIGKRELEFKFHGEKIKNFKYFEMFVFTPCIYTFSMNSYDNHEKYYFTRIFCIAWLFYSFEISWKYGKVNNK